MTDWEKLLAAADGNEEEPEPFSDFTLDLFYTLQDRYTDKYGSSPRKIFMHPDDYECFRRSIAEAQKIVPILDHGNTITFEGVEIVILFTVTLGKPVMVQ